MYRHYTIKIFNNLLNVLSLTQHLMRQDENRKTIPCILVSLNLIEYINMLDYLPAFLSIYVRSNTDLGRIDSIEGKALALHVADSDLVPSTQNGSPGIARSEPRVRSKP